MLCILRIPKIKSNMKFSYTVRLFQTKSPPYFFFFYDLTFFFVRIFFFRRILPEKNIVSCVHFDCAIDRNIFSICFHNNVFPSFFFPLLHKQHVLGYKIKMNEMFSSLLQMIEMFQSCEKTIRNSFLYLFSIKNKIFFPIIFCSFLKQSLFPFFPL